MSDIYKYYNKNKIDEVMFYISDSINLISNKFSYTSVNGITITNEENIVIKNLLSIIENLTADFDSVNNNSSTHFMKLKSYNIKLREIRGLPPLESAVTLDVGKNKTRE